MKGDNDYKKYGRVMNVRNENGNVRVDVRVLNSHGRIQTNLMVEKLAPGFMIVPKTGWIVALEKGPDGEFNVTGVTSGPETHGEDSVQDGFQLSLPPDKEQFGIADDMEPGTAVFQLDRQTGIVFRYDEAKGTYDLELHAGGDLIKNIGGQVVENTGVTMPSEQDGLTKNPPQ